MYSLPSTLVFITIIILLRQLSTIVPPSPEDPLTGVSSKDVNITTELRARIYLPKLTSDDQKLPILLWFHGGGFFMGSAFQDTEHAFINFMASRAPAIAISVDYRLVPEHHLPAAYEDAWTAVQWAATNCTEPWLVQYGDFDQIFIGGDSAGANIVHNTLIRAGLEQQPNGAVKIMGGIQLLPYFWGSNETCWNALAKWFYKWVWKFAFPTAPGGIDNPMVNPFSEKAPSLSLLGCSKLFVVVGELDPLRDVGVRYANAVKESNKVKLVELKGLGHSIGDLYSEETQQLITDMASFICKLNFIG